MVEITPDNNTDYQYLLAHRKVWKDKSVLRRIYQEQFYDRLLNNIVEGQHTLEIGSGPGFLQEIAPDIWRTDILPSPWIHSAADIHTLPFASNTFSNAIGLDVLHHFSQPVLALEEVARVLQPGGHLVLVEPWITPLSRFIYTHLHQEDCDLAVQPWRTDASSFESDKKAFEGNAAIPYLLVNKGELDSLLPQMSLIKLERFCSLTYLLSGGFKPLSLLPEPLYPFLYSLEQRTQPLWAGLAALRVLLVWQKAAA